MAHEQGMRVFRQASDDAREMAMRVRRFRTMKIVNNQQFALFLGDSRSRIESEPEPLEDTSCVGVEDDPGDSQDD